MLRTTETKTAELVRSIRSLRSPLNRHAVSAFTSKGQSAHEAVFARQPAWKLMSRCSEPLFNTKPGKSSCRGWRLNLWLCEPLAVPGHADSPSA